MPDGAVSVTRPGRWGNPFVVSENHRPGVKVGGWYIAVPTTEDAVECYREWLNQNPDVLAAVISELRGKDLACFCKLDAPCHADILLEIANENRGV